MSIVNRFEYDIQKKLVEICGQLKGKRIVVALSGGADSVCLLNVLCVLSEKLKFKLSAIHVNHMIRGEEADRDAAFCISLCKQKKVKLLVYREDIPALAKKNGESLELCARNYRYETFEEHCAEHCIDFIATAHNANDNAETVLYNVLRGTGIDGVCGIPQRRNNIIRPILYKTRDEILRYLECKGEQYVVDSTNFEIDYSRNYIRNVIIPAAQKINSNITGALNSLSALAHEDRSFFDGKLKQYIEKKQESGIDYRELEGPVRKRAIRNAYIHFFGTPPETKHLNALNTAFECNSEKDVYLPNNYLARTYNGVLSFYRSNLPKIPFTPCELREGYNFVVGSFVKVQLSYGPWRLPVNLTSELKFAVSLDNSKIKGKLYVRDRKTGDSFIVKGINRNVKKDFINNKVPAFIRSRVPIICDDEGIVYVPFIGIADRVFYKHGNDACNISIDINERVGQR